MFYNSQGVPITEPFSQTESTTFTTQQTEASIIGTDAIPPLPTITSQDELPEISISTDEINDTHSTPECVCVCDKPQEINTTSVDPVEVQTELLSSPDVPTTVDEVIEVVTTNDKRNEVPIKIEKSNKGDITSVTVLQLLTMCALVSLL